MGNQLVGIAPSQIFPVEHYLTELTDYKYDISLGSTRFLKVARAESQEGLTVVKVFAIHDPSLPLAPYQSQLERIRKKLASSLNCLPFQKIIETDKAGLIIREFVKHSLYDRISTRPFLTNIEKRWITFQVLYALHQCHNVGVCHGDIKLENITVTSWNWVLLVDFASFKPTFLPEDNPADYSYFFDTSRRRICYIAPERFIKTLTLDSNALFNESLCDSGELKPPMDIFSAGCALLELWNEGHAPFELSQLLAYKTGEYSPQKHLDRLEDPDLRNLIASMIQRDPNQRLSAELYLAQERGRLFPEYFYTFLQSYMLIFSTRLILSPDEKIARLKNDIGNMFKFLKADEDTNGKDNDGLVIIVSLVTSCIRGLHDCTTKLQSLEIMQELATHTNDETILDRIIPFIMFLMLDVNSRVKVAAINTVTNCLKMVKKVPRSDANVFPEYVLPGLAPLASDRCSYVRAAYAKNIANLAETAVLYLEQTQADCGDKGTANNSFNYDVELQTLHEMLQKTVCLLLADPEAHVKQILMDSGITKLCVFFGRQKANDIILSHMITFLNDKQDKELRGTFYDCIVGVAAFIGWQCSSIITPLLLQGLTDSCEFVIAKAITAMVSLAELGLLRKPMMIDVVCECACFLVHPNLWIRQALTGFICVAAKELYMLDVSCYIIPTIKLYMEYSIFQIHRQELLLDSLVPPIPRNVYDNVVKYNDIEALMETLTMRQKSRNLMVTGFVASGDISTSIKNLIRRLEANGMTTVIEEKLLMMSSHLEKISKHRLLSDNNNSERIAIQADGKIEIKSLSSNARSHVVNLNDVRSKCDFASVQSGSDHISRRQSESTNSGGPPSRSSRPPSPLPEAIRFGSDSVPTMSLHEKSYIQYRTSSCAIELQNLVRRQQDRYFEAMRGRDWAEQAVCKPELPPPGWQLKGSLVAHLHEHRGPVTKLCPIPETPFFASSSIDGTVRLWDCSKMEGKNIANRSKEYYKMPNNSPIESMAVCDNGQSLAAATRDGNINILRVDGSKLSLLSNRTLDAAEEKSVVDIQYLDSQNVLVYATLYGSLVAWDLRAPGNAWRLENGLKKGLICSFCLDSHKSWLTLGTASGYHICWDLRFQLPITTIKHPSSARIRKVVTHPTEPSWIISSVQGNNEISMWNLETGARERVLWGSSTPPLSKSHLSSQSNQAVCAMYTGCIDRSGFLLAGGSDQRLRFWDLQIPSQSYIAIPSPNDFLGPSRVYQSRQVDGTNVVVEACEDPPPYGQPSINLKPDEIPRAGPEPPPTGHRDSITDIALCKTKQCFMLTSSRDGVIKIWK
ncbi:PREDICTED: phosphoinositide 3-kinase regulatory subunit 4 [Nicrophorus vespilloides]|uniref:non-specific serine/threonine protein kinase n=1 Tax=Nicrophorus vespilloides TaxID=110193 RepID=A0ABM1MB14_NICVS|nr:PREDICTED: phosphoinositide 3-kinase regulatory subunit 4 [Nicrophorus vespilloides]